jgi:hypothetical protein
MGIQLLDDLWVEICLLFVGVLVVISVVHSTLRQSKPEIVTAASIANWLGDGI